MEVRVKIYGCYELTYTPVYKDILSKIYGSSFNVESAILEIEDISLDDRNKERTIQSQRSLDAYTTRAIRIYEDGVLKHIIGMSNTNFDEDKKHEFDIGKSRKEKSTYGEGQYHANTYMAQGINKIFSFYFENKETADLSFYLLDLDETYPHNLFNTLSYRELETIGFRILNINEVDFSEYEKKCKSTINHNNLVFPSFHKFMRDIAYISERNEGNVPSFLQCNEYEIHDEDGGISYMTEKYIYTFKALSAQGYDSLLRCWTMKVLADKEEVEIEFRLGKQYFAYEQDVRRISEELTGPIKNIFMCAGLNLEYTTDETFMNERRLADNVYLRHKADNELRNQPLFRNNIRKKGIPEECSVCGEDNPDLLDAAHLWEVNSIKNASSSEINNFIRINNLKELIDQRSEYKNEIFFKKYSLVNSGENGIWLCKNHHKLFDSNYYCFESENGRILLHFKNPNDAIEFAEQFNQVKLDPEILTKATKAFLSQRQLVFNI